MGTHAVIAMATDNGYEAIGLNYDGYPGHAGAILGGWYNTAEKVAELIALGNLSQIYQRIAPNASEEHSLISPAKDVTVAYHRDRGEAFDNLGTFESKTAMTSLCKYIYVFENGRWLVWGITRNEWIELSVKVGNQE